MKKTIFLLIALMLLSGCALLEPRKVPPPPEPGAMLIVPEGTEFAANLLGYSQAVRVGPWISTSAIPGFDIKKRAFPATFEDQVSVAFELLEKVLAASGAKMSDVTEITTYQLDMNEFFVTVDARNQAFGDHRPTWTPVGVPGMALPAMQFQISARAYVPESGAPAQVVKLIESGISTEETAGAEKSEERKTFRNRPGY